MREAIKIFAAVIISSFLFGCASVPSSSQQTVIQLANDAVQKAGFRFEYYQPPRVRYASSIGHQWLVCYDSKMHPAIPPGGLLPASTEPIVESITIFVDDKTGAVDLAHNEPPDYSQFPKH